MKPADEWATPLLWAALVLGLLACAARALLWLWQNRVWVRRWVGWRAQRPMPPGLLGSKHETWDSFERALDRWETQRPSREVRYSRWN